MIHFLPDRCNFSMARLAHLLVQLLALAGAASAQYCNKGPDYVYIGGAGKDSAGKCPQFRDCECDGTQVCYLGDCGINPNGTADCMSPDYHFDEAVGYVCRNSCECDGMRACQENEFRRDEKKCMGTARGGSGKSKCTKSRSYMWDEVPNAHRCEYDCMCDGERICSAYNYCAGRARPVCNKTVNYQVDESISMDKYGVDCQDDCDCKGMRTCDQNRQICVGIDPFCSKSANYHVDESATVINGNAAPNACLIGSSAPEGATEDCWCDGLRTCGGLYCEGDAGH